MHYSEEGRLKMMNKKGQAVFSQLAALGVGIAGLVVTLVVTFLIISQGRSQAGSIDGVDQNSCITLGDAVNTSPSAACNATIELGDAVGDIPGWVPLIIITVIGSILLGLVSLFRR